MSKKYELIYHVDGNNEYRWNILHGNGRIVAASSEGFPTYTKAKANLKRIVASLMALTAADPKLNGVKSWKLGAFIIAGLCAIMLTGCTGLVPVPCTTLTIDPVHHKVSWDNSKDTVLKGVHVGFNTNGTYSMDIESASTVMNPQVIDSSGAASAAVEKERWIGINNVIQSSGTAGGSMIGAAAKTAVKP